MIYNDRDSTKKHSFIKARKNYINSNHNCHPSLINFNSFFCGFENGRFFQHIQDILNLKFLDKLIRIIVSIGILLQNFTLFLKIKNLGHFERRIQKNGYTHDSCNIFDKKEKIKSFILRVKDLYQTKICEIIEI